MLQGKNILLGVCGGIAAYKTALLVRLWVKAGANVKVIMTPHAEDFITPLTLATLSKNPVHCAFVTDTQTGVWANHVELGIWADFFVIAPATAHTLAKLANGFCDNLLTAVYLSAKCPVMLAPAMDKDMWAHSATQENIKKLSHAGNIIVDVEEGELASGLAGKGRMAEPETIVNQLIDSVKKNDSPQTFSAKKVLITAGATRESIDPVRFLSNRSTGKMGVAIADSFVKHGAQVTLVKGFTTVEPQQPQMDIINVTSANDMFKAVTSIHTHFDIVVMVAAVADYTPQTSAKSKIKKGDGNLTITLARTQDVLAYLGKHKPQKQILVGFALETDNEIVNAKKKLQKKNLDIIALNSLGDKGAGFAHNTNKITIIDKHNNIRKFELKNKTLVAADILDTIKNYINA